MNHVQKTSKKGVTGGSPRGSKRHGLLVRHQPRLEFAPVANDGLCCTPAALPSAAAITAASTKLRCVKARIRIDTRGTSRNALVPILVATNAEYHPSGVFGFNWLRFWVKERRAKLGQYDASRWPPSDPPLPAPSRGN